MQQQLEWWDEHSGRSGAIAWHGVRCSHASAVFFSRRGFIRIDHAGCGIREALHCSDAPCARRVHIVDPCRLGRRRRARTRLDGLCATIHLALARWRSEYISHVRLERAHLLERL